MTHRERWEAVFAGRRPDVMAWFGDLTYWHFAHQQIGDLPERWRGPSGRHEMHRDLNIGEYIPGFELLDTIDGSGVRREVADNGQTRVTQWHTPLGTLREVEEYCPSSFSWGYLEHAVKDAGDLRILRHIFENRAYESHPERYYKIDQEYLAYGFGPPHVASPATPMLELNKHWVGVMELAYLLADEPVEFRKTLAAITEAHDRAYRLIAAGPCPYIMVCENLSGNTMGSYFDEYIAPPLCRWMDWLHATGKKAMIHIDGTLKGAIEKIGATGMDCVDAVTPKPVGDVGMDEIRKLAGERILLLGGIPGAMFAPPFTARDMERHVKEIIRLHKDSGTFMFGVADQVPPNGDLRLVKLVSDLVEEYGRY